MWPPTPGSCTSTTTRWCCPCPRPAHQHAGATAYVDADLHDPGRILAAAAETLDFTQPIGLMLLGILGHIDDDDEARSILKRLLGAVPSGSYLTICEGTNDLSQAGVEAQQLYNESGAAPYDSAALSRLPTSSRGWSSWSPAWCRARDGGPIPVISVAASPLRWINSPGWVASRNRIATPAASSTGQRCLARH